MNTCDKNNNIHWRNVRSGSALLDLILSNDSEAKSLGETYALFEPTRKHHFEELEKLKTDNVWAKILIGGKKKLYPNLIKYSRKLIFLLIPLRTLI